MSHVTKHIHSSPIAEVSETRNLSTPGLHTDVKSKRTERRETVKSTNKTRFNSVQEPSTIS